MIKEDAVYWIFENNNKYTKAVFSKEEATKYNKTLVNCSNCDNCIYCTNCSNCDNCIYCTNCSNCSNCDKFENNVLSKQFDFLFKDLKCYEMFKIRKQKNDN